MLGLESLPDPFGGTAPWSLATGPRPCRIGSGRIPRVRPGGNVMSGEPDRVEVVCCRCDAVNPEGATSCVMCGHAALDPAHTTANPYEPPKAPLGDDETTTLGTLGRVFSYVVGVVLIILSGLIAFTATCFPIGLISLGSDFQAGIILGIFVGIVAGGAALYYSIKLFRHVMRRKGQGGP